MVPAQRPAFGVDVLPGLAAGVEHAVGDHLHRRVELEVLPLRPVRTAVPDLRDAGRAGDQRLARAALGAEPAAVDRRVGVALDLDDLLVLHVHVLRAADGAVGADALARRGRRSRCATPRRRSPCCARPCRGPADRSRSAAGTPARHRARSSPAELCHPELHPARRADATVLLGQTAVRSGRLSTPRAWSSCRPPRRTTAQLQERGESQSAIMSAGSAVRRMSRR